MSHYGQRERCSIYQGAGRACDSYCTSSDSGKRRGRESNCAGSRSWVRTIGGRDTARKCRVAKRYGARETRGACEGNRTGTARGSLIDALTGWRDGQSKV